VSDPASYSVERLLDAFAKVPAHVAVMRGPNHIYAFVNEAYRAVLGIEEAVGKPFGSAQHPTSAGLRAVLDQVYATGEPWAAEEMRLVSLGTEKRDRYFNVNFIPLRGENNQIDGVMLHSFDVTELVRAREAVAANEARLLHVQKLESLGVLAGGIAHDFNNMLAAVQGCISMGALMLSSAHPVQAVLRDALAAVRRAADLTRQLLAYSGKGAFQIQRMDLSSHVAELSHLLETTLSKKVQLRLELQPDLPIEGDPAQIQQIVMNLVLNGAEAIGDERGTVLVTTGLQEVDPAYASTLLAPGELPPGRYCYLEVHDTGCGMNEETRAKIFDPFFTTKFTGRGLGLAAVLGIVKSHKGAIKVYSTPGKGTTFKVLFAAGPGGPIPREGRAPLDELRGSGLALVIDDDAGVRQVLRHLLEHFGFDVIEAADGRLGVQAFASRMAEVKFVVLDMTMPELSGEETLSELRRLRPGVPVILSSGYNEVEATRKVTAKGFAAFLPKPFTPDELAQCIRAALS
jgi:signal transduction histidine kinase/CheY-like chemotaxis protein